MQRCRPVLVALLAFVLACAPATDEDSTELDAPPRPGPARIEPVGIESVTIDDSFWKPRLETNRRVTIPHILDKNEETGRVANFEKAAGLREGPYEGRRFNDTDVYKIIEAASYVLAQEHDAELDARIDALIELIAAAQREDGYLFPAYTIDPENPAPGVGTEPWVHVEAGSHELYNAGHLIEAAVAHHRATGKRSLLDVAIRFADHIDEEFGPDGNHSIPGHEEIELALVKLADHTGEDRYLELARFFLDQRGGDSHGRGYPEDTPFAIYNDRDYKQDHAPVIEQSEATGHAVRATYLYTGMADVAARTEAPGYREALDRIWEDLVSHKLYVTGGVGSRDTFESFGEDYELPNATAYTETCAAIGNDLWNHRMFLSTGDPAYLDVLERVLYNGTLSGVSVEGDSFFYTNPLESAGEVGRSEYFEVACCPANLARLMALLPGFIYATEGNTVYVNLFIGSEATIELPAGRVRIRQQTEYPWDGSVRLEIEPERPMEVEVALRIPGWALERPVPSDLYTFANEDPSDGPVVRYSELEVPTRPGQYGELVRVGGPIEEEAVIELELPMPVRRVRSQPSVEENTGKVALQRGPLVYAVEAADNGGSALDIVLPDEAGLRAEFDPALLGGMTLVHAPATRNVDGAAREHELVAVPYFAWANRGAGEMAVWIPTPER